MNALKSIGLCCGSLVQADFRGLVEAASAAGFGSISLWPTLFYGAMDAGLSAQDMRSMLDDNGLQVTELDPFSSWLPVDMKPDDLGAVFHAFTEDDFFRMADSLGARSLNIIQQSPAKVSDARRAELINALCERAARHGLLVTIEFLPWSPIGSLGKALELVAAVDHPNFGINIDTWHHFRSGGTLQDIAAVDPATISAVQFNDVLEQPWNNLLEETALARLPLRPPVERVRLRQSGSRLPYSVSFIK